ncbi:MAG: P-loop ATPase, Sll1717 family [Microcoleus sp.]
MLHIKKIPEYNLRDIFLGEADGQDEALSRPDFVNFFYDYDNISEKVNQPLKYLILGKKGTGKTLLGEYINETNRNKQNTSHIVSFKEFRTHELRYLSSNDTAPNEYIAIWKWICLIELAKLLVKNSRIQTGDVYKRINTFINQNYSCLILTENSQRDIQKLTNISADFVAPLEEPSTNYSSDNYNYINFVPVLESLVETLIKQDASHKYTLILDELDDRFKNEDVYKNSIISLIKAVDYFNKKYLRNRYNVKIMILLRSDIFSLLNDTDLNKREQSNAVKINWGDKASFSSPLFDLIEKKIKASIPEFNSFTRDEVINIFFPEEYVGNKNVKTDEFLLSRTLFRPRDLITYLTIVQERTPNSEEFSGKAILEAERAYSEYFFKELQNEMHGHINNDAIQEITTLLIKFSKFRFDYKDIEVFEKQQNCLQNISLREALKYLFDFSIIGNKWENQRTNQWRHAWKHRHDQVNIDYDKQFVLHYGLFKYFNV